MAALCCLLTSLPPHHGHWYQPPLSRTNGCTTHAIRATPPRTVVASTAVATANTENGRRGASSRIRQMDKDPDCNDSGKGDGTMNTEDDYDLQQQAVRRHTLPPETMNVLSQQFALVTESLLVDNRKGSLLTYRHDDDDSIHVDESVESVASTSQTANISTEWTPLQWACYQGDLDTVQRLLQDDESDCNIEETDHNGRTALHLCLLGELDASKDEGDNDDVKCPRTMAHVIRYLFESCHANVDAVDGDGFTLLHRACFNNEWRVIPYLMERCQVDVDAVTINDDQNTALHVASAAGHLSVIELLLDYGASIYDENAQGQTPLDYATAMMHQQQQGGVGSFSSTFLDPNVVALLSATTGPGVRRE